jgi:ribosome-binding factor A
MLKGKIKKNTYSQRQLKVGEIIKKSLSDFLYRDTIHDDDLQNVSITITQVTVSPDLKQATAYVMPLGGMGTMDIVGALNKNSKYIRGRIAPKLFLKFTPSIVYKEDQTFEYASKIDRLLNNLSRS